MGDGTIVPPVTAQCVDVVAGAGCNTGFMLVLSLNGGEAGTCTTSVDVGDAVPPTADPLDAIQVQCIADVPQPDPGIVSATDLCSAVTVTFVGDQSDGETCPEIITRTYRATDACGNAVDVTQAIRVWDTVPPTIVCPADQTFECSAIGDAGTATADDNCDIAGQRRSGRQDRRGCVPRGVRDRAHVDGDG